METQKILNSKKKKKKKKEKEIDKEESELEESGSLTSDYTTVLE